MDECLILVNIKSALVDIIHMVVHIVVWDADYSELVQIGEAYDEG